MNTKGIKYSIFDPTGNITALVETRVDSEMQPAVADEIMKIHPDVEQVGFVYFEPGRPVPALLRMAGGEFCGNATMSAAALCAIRSGDEAESIRVRASGVSRSLEVRLKRNSEDSSLFDTGVELPEPVSIGKMKFTSEDVTEELSVVDMGGISHIIIEKKRQMYSLKDNPNQAERAVKEWCNMLGADCLGVMFVSGSESASKSKDMTRRETRVGVDMEMETELIPLVYVPGADTLFWENSCASGSAAAGMYLSDKYGVALEVVMKEPAGTLRVKSDLAKGLTWLYGSTKYIDTFLMDDK